MIPNKIHYIWIGKDLDVLGSELRRKCFNTVYNYCKKTRADFSLWTDEDFKDIIDNNKYLQYLYNEKHYALVADYFKYYIVYKEGGMYLDTDIEILDNFPQEMLDTNDYLFCSTNSQYTLFHTVLSASFVCAKPQSELIKKVLDVYDNRLFTIKNPTKYDTYMDCAISMEAFKDFQIQTMAFFPDSCNEEIALRDKSINCIHYNCLIADAQPTYMRNHYEGSWYTGRPTMWKMSDDKS